MKLRHQHPWNLSPKEAIELQRKLQPHIDLEDRLESIGLVAGTDVGFEDKGKTTRAAVVILEYPSLALVDQALYRTPTSFPYVPGLLSFREIPAVLGAMQQLRHKPDLLLCDGQGIAHPRRFGIACHLGLLTDIPSIGVGKSRLTGTHEEPGNQKGSWQPLMDGGDCIGAVLRSRTGVSPIYISPGHKISLETSIGIVMNCVTRFRLPETTRAAHNLASNK